MRKARPYRVVDVEPLSEEWKAERRKVITATDVATLLGECPWPREISVSQRRADLLRRKRTGEEIKQTRRMLWGDLSERANGKIIFERGLGMRYRQSRAFLVSKDLPLGCTLDGFAFQSVAKPCDHRLFSDGGEHFALESWQGLMLAELKQTDQYNLKEWQNGPPRHYELQARAQLLVTGLDICALACRIGAADARVWFVQKDKYDAEKIELAVLKAAKELG